MNNEELNQAIQEIENESSGVEIKLFDSKNNNILYKTLTIHELTGILTALKGIERNRFKGDK